jgi:hypothetical protein
MSGRIASRIGESLGDIRARRAGNAVAWHFAGFHRSSLKPRIKVAIYTQTGVGSRQFVAIRAGWGLE